MVTNEIEHDESVVTVSKEHVGLLLRELAEMAYLVPTDSIRGNFYEDHPLYRLAELFDVE